MSNLYVNQKEYDFLVNLIEEAMLTCGEIDADGYDCADSLLKKLGYPEIYRNNIWSKIVCKDFRYKERCKVPRHYLFDENLIRRDEHIKTLLENNVYKFRCENCGIFVKTLSLHCPQCKKEGFLCGSFKDEDLKKWIEDHV
jgi:hypothetical protein